MQLTAVVVSAGLASRGPAAHRASAYWLIPAVFGSAYRGAVPLLWLLTPGGIFLACGQVAGDLLRGLNRPDWWPSPRDSPPSSPWSCSSRCSRVMGVAAAAIASTVAYGIALAAMLRCLQLVRPARQGTREGSTRSRACP